MHAQQHDIAGKGLVLVSDSPGLNLPLNCYVILCKLLNISEHHFYLCPLNDDNGT